MEGSLAEPHTGSAPRRCTVDHRLHEPATNALVLHSGIDRYRPDTNHCGTLVQKVAADDFAIAFGDYAVPSGMVDHHA
jgi:hypothetical protein